jgi:hypothetical protein
MDLAAVANGSQNNISDAGVSQSVAIDVLKKAQDIDQTNATALIQAIPQAPTTPNLPANLGKNVNTTA